MVRELQIWSRLYHKNVLRLLGYSVDGGLYYLSLITEWMDNGTVLHYMRVKGEKVDLLHMVWKVLSIPSGGKLIEKHLAGTGHRSGTRIPSYEEHCTLRHEVGESREITHAGSFSPLPYITQGNVLISPAGEPLVTDFGISHMLSSSTVASLTTGTYGTVRWMAYEQINVDEAQSSTPYTFQTDVWAFGMTILVSFSPLTFFVIFHPPPLLLSQPADVHSRLIGIAYAGASLCTPSDGPAGHYRHIQRSTSPQTPCLRHRMEHGTKASLGSMRIVLGSRCGCAAHVEGRHDEIGCYSRSSKLKFCLTVGGIPLRNTFSEYFSLF